MSAAPKSFLSLELLDNRYPALHGLRVLAIVSVVQFHVTEILFFVEKMPLHPLFVASSMTVFFGMDLFFVLSGFLIGSILLHALETTQGGASTLKRFYLRRIFRTFPAYYLTLLLLVVARGLNQKQAHNLPFEIAYLTDFVFPLDPSTTSMPWGWSLALEEQFYLLVPFLFLGLGRIKTDRARVIALGALWIAPLLVRLYVFYHYHPRGWELHEKLYFRAYSRFDTLVAGMILAVVHRTWHADLERWLAHPRHRAMLQVPALACLWLLLKPNMFGDGATGLVTMFLWGTVTSVMYVCIGLLLLHGKGAVHSWLGDLTFRRIATLGYGVYLVHVPMCDWLVVPLARWLDRHHVTMIVVWPLSVVLTVLAALALAYVMHLLIEKPSMWFREKLAA